MSNTNNRQVVEAIINDFVGQKKSFTNMDVARKVNEGQYVRYSEVRNIVREWVGNNAANYDYETSSIRVTLDDGSNVSANLYHHEEVDPDEYMERSQSLLKRDSTPTLPDSDQSQQPVSDPVTAPVATITAAAPVDLKSILGGSSSSDDSTSPKTADDILAAALKSAQDAQNKFFSR